MTNSCPHGQPSEQSCYLCELQARVEELETAAAKIRADALKEAAKVAESNRMTIIPQLADSVLTLAVSAAHKIVKREIAEQIRALIDKPATTPDTDGWIEWRGGECPVPRDTVVDIRCRDSDEYLQRPAFVWSWDHQQDDDDIVAYRIARGCA